MHWIYVKHIGAEKNVPLPICATIVTNECAVPVASGASRAKQPHAMIVTPTVPNAHVPNAGGAPTTTISIVNDYSEILFQPNE